MFNSSILNKKYGISIDMFQFESYVDLLLKSVALGQPELPNEEITALKLSLTSEKEDSYCIIGDYEETITPWVLPTTIQSYLNPNQTYDHKLNDILPSTLPNFDTAWLIQSNLNGYQVVMSYHNGNLTSAHLVNNEGTVGKDVLPLISKLCPTHLPQLVKTPQFQILGKLICTASPEYTSPYSYLTECIWENHYKENLQFIAEHMISKYIQLEQMSYEKALLQNIGFTNAPYVVINNLDISKLDYGLDKASQKLYMETKLPITDKLSVFIDSKAKLNTLPITLRHSLNNVIVTMPFEVSTQAKILKKYWVNLERELQICLVCKCLLNNSTLLINLPLNKMQPFNIGDLISINYNIYTENYTYQEV